LSSGKLATPCALAALWSCTDGMGRPKAATLGQLAGLLSSRPLRPWAAVKPEEIVDFFIFLELLKWSSNQIWFEFEFIPDLFQVEN
jgi:hypothetical protein